jgi:hypothetical protein
MHRGSQIPPPGHSLTKPCSCKVFLLLPSTSNFSSLLSLCQVFWGTSKECRFPLLRCSLSNELGLWIRRGVSAIKPYLWVLVIMTMQLEN